MIQPSFGRALTRFSVAGDTSLSPEQREDLEFTEAASGCLMIPCLVLAMPLVWILLYQLHVVWRPRLDGAVHLVRGQWMLAILTGVFVAIMVSYWTVVCICLLALRERYRRYDEWEKSKHPLINVAPRYVTVLSVAATIAICTVMSHTYTALYEDRIEIRRALDWSPRSYAYKDVHAVRVWQTEHQDSDYMDGHLAIDFTDGTAWDSSNSKCYLESKQASTMGNFIAQKSGIEIERERLD